MVLKDRTAAELIATVIFLLGFTWVATIFVPAAHLTYAGQMFSGIVLALAIIMGAIIVADAIKGTAKAAKKKK